MLRIDAMNQRHVLAGLIATACLLALGNGRAWAQAGPYVTQGPYGASQYGYGTPRLSPYLNLLRGGNNTVNAAANYYLGVIPEVERRANARVFGTQIQELERRVQGSEEATDIFPRLTETGHPAVFNNVGTYFGTNLQRPMTSPPGLNRPPPARGR
jgi:hypothetical protein